jgi:hypothetical protein
MQSTPITVRGGATRAGSAFMSWIASDLLHGRGRVSASERRTWDVAALTRQLDIFPPDR